MTAQFANGARSSARSMMVMPTRMAFTAATGRTVALPSPRHGTQAYFWTSDWQQKETLADFDYLIGDVYNPMDVEDLIRELDADDEE